MQAVLTTCLTLRGLPLGNPSGKETCGSLCEAQAWVLLAESIGPVLCGGIVRDYPGRAGEFGVSSAGGASRQTHAR